MKQPRHIHDLLTVMLKELQELLNLAIYRDVDINTLKTSEFYYSSKGILYPFPMKDTLPFGLCRLCFMIEKITDDERDIIQDYINANRPSMFSSLDAFRHRKEIYFWTKGRIYPRYRWLKKHINKTRPLA